TLHDEAEWALTQIAPEHATQSATHVSPAASQVSPQPQTTAPETGNPPIAWNTASGSNIVWSAELGDNTFGRPVVVGDVVYVGTDNARRRNPSCQEDCGVLTAFRAKDGAFLWQDVATRVDRGLREFLLPSTTSAPLVDGDRLYYVTAEC